MTSRDLVIRTLNHERVDRVPRDLCVLPGVEALRSDELAEIEVRFPRDVVRTELKHPPGKRSKGKPQQVGRYTDAWGCTWEVTERDSPGRLQQPPLDSAAKTAEYQPPFEILSGAKLSKVNRTCAATSRFVLGVTECRPLERLQLLRGRQTALADLARGSKRIRDLLAMLHDFFCREIELWARSDVDAIAIVDNCGSEDALLVTPQVWRDLLMPLYRDYCRIIHAEDKFAFFHSDGDVSDIFRDLVKIGVDAIGSQPLLMGIERLARRFRGRVTFWGEIDRRQTLPRGTAEEIRQAVLRIRRALDFGAGGLIAQCRWGPDVPRENIAALFEQWILPLPMHAT